MVFPEITFSKYIFFKLRAERADFRRILKTPTCHKLMPNFPILAQKSCILTHENGIWAHVSDMLLIVKFS